MLVGNYLGTKGCKYIHFLFKLAIKTVLVHLDSEFSFQRQRLNALLI